MPASCSVSKACGINLSCASTRRFGVIWLYRGGDVLYRTVLHHMFCTEARRRRGEGRPRESEKCFKARMPRREAVVLDVLTSVGGREAATIKRARRETAPAPPVVHTGPSASEFRQSRRLSSRPFARSGRCSVRGLVRGRTHREKQGSSQSCIACPGKSSQVP